MRQLLCLGIMAALFTFACEEVEVDDAAAGDAPAGLVGWPAVSKPAFAVTTPTVSASNQPVVADFNHDGKDDVAMTSTSSPANVVIYRGTASRVLSANQVLAIPDMAPTIVQGMTAAELNGDGYLDLVVSMHTTAYDETPPEGWLYTYNYEPASGAFEENTPFHIVGYQPYRPFVGDVTGDGKVDVLLHGRVDAYSSATLLFRGLGDGQFEPLEELNGVLNIRGLADLTGDGKLDAVTSGTVDNPTASYINVHPGNGNGTFSGAVTFSLTSSFNQVLFGDMNQDGRRDMVVKYGGNDKTAVLYCTPTATGLTATKTEYSPYWSYASRMNALADINRDGKLDIISGGSYKPPLGKWYPTMNIFWGNGLGTGKLVRMVDTSQWWGEYPLLGDFDGDGKLDMGLTMYNNRDPYKLTIVQGPIVK